jgi:hypothetical protein
MDWIIWRWLKFRAISLLFANLSKSVKYYVLYNNFNLIIFDEVSNDNEIIRNLSHHQSINIKTYL